MSPDAVVRRSAVEIRPLRAGDAELVRRMFTTTFLLGAPIPFVPVRWREYVDLCLGWYLEPGRVGGALATDGAGAPVGYALWCGEPAAHARDARRRSLRLVAGLAADAGTFRLDAESRAFYRARLRDVGRLARPIEGPHVHLNVSAGHRTGAATYLLRDHLDGIAGAAGAPHWSGEINARRGARSRALTRLGFTVVDRHPNHTFSLLLGTPVERLTIVRRTP